MARNLPLKVLLVAEGSGGHLIPALQVADTLAKTGATIKVWYAQRRQVASLSNALTQAHVHDHIEVDPILVESGSNPMARLWQCGQLWYRAQRCFNTFAPDVVVGFGGWVSAPIVLAAKRRRIGCLLHEQNVTMGKANRWLSRWADRVAVSFQETQQLPEGTRSVVTGMPVRTGIGTMSRVEAAVQYQLDPSRPTVLVLGGSQGARTINCLMIDVAAAMAPRERAVWQILHMTGVADERAVKDAYTAHHLAAWVAPYLVHMDAAYALADLVIARAGASTIAELARCGTPAILIPYPGADAHQRANAKVAETCGGAVMCEEAQVTSQRLLDAMQRILRDERLRRIMGAQMRTLHRDHADEQLTEVIVEMAQARTYQEQGCV
ncbi:MAG: undecaprenyldiphospho-muramoylpentapeptide beta-N-acetylglucosaminyltransferase [Candidatus Omnitrophica bacterium]|nr:undecaprenyldiphospho-muramoylpentapeptide beta-N-acetylglucosaminyltransferase [Candidatus Omnitrophota bacterium]